MKLHKIPIEGAFLIEMNSNRDERGIFTEAFVDQAFSDLSEFKFQVFQANLSTSVQAGTVRGLHWQADPYGQAKLVCSAEGVIQDVLVDVRPESKTFGMKFSPLIFRHHSAVYVPKGVAHGWQALTPGATLLYLVDAPWAPGQERGVRYDDPDVDVKWLLPPRLVSKKDLAWPNLRELKTG